MDAIVGVRALLGIAAAGLVGAALGFAWLYGGGLPLPSRVTVEPMKPSASLPTFAQVRAGRQPTTAELQLVDPKTGKRNDTPSTFANGWVHRDTRERSTQSVRDALDQPWSVYCTEAGRKRIASALSGYFFHRTNQRNLYVGFWGETGRRFIEDAWNDPANQRIDDLLRDQYERGYLNLADFQPHVRAAIGAIAGNRKPRAQPCEP
jgi:hypothetical protein